MTDDRLFLGCHDGINVVADTGQDAEHGGGRRRGGGEEPEVVRPRRQRGEKVPDRVAISAARLPYFDTRYR